MNQRSDPNDTSDSTSGSVEDEIRRRFRAALEQSRFDGSAPDPAEYVAEVPEPAQSRLRKELESIRSAQPATVPDSKNGDTRAEPPEIDAATADWIPGVLPNVSQLEMMADQVPGPAAPDSAALPNQETVKPPAEKTLGTSDYEPSSPSPRP